MTVVCIELTFGACSECEWNILVAVHHMTNTKWTGTHSMYSWVTMQHCLIYGSHLLVPPECVYLFCVATQPGTDISMVFAYVHSQYMIVLCGCPTMHWHIHGVCLCPQPVCDCSVWLPNQALTHSPCLLVSTVGMWLFCVAQQGTDTSTMFSCVHRLYVIVLCGCLTRHWYIHGVCLCPQPVCDCSVWLPNQALTHSPCFLVLTVCMWLFCVAAQPGTDIFTIFACVHSQYAIVLCCCPTRHWHIPHVCLCSQFVCDYSVWLPNQALTHSLCLCSQFVCDYSV
jgi:hypothetical protein